MRPGVAHGGRATSGSSDDDSRRRQGHGARGETTSDGASVEGMAARVSALADHAERGGAGRAARRFDAGAGPRDSFAAVIDGLSAELDLPRAELVRELVDEMRRQIATDRAALDYLLGIAESERHAE